MWMQHPFILYGATSGGVCVCVFVSNFSLDESVVFNDLFWQQERWV